MGLGALDIVFLVLSVLASTAIGIYYGYKGRKSTPLEYLLGGRNIQPLPLAMSMTVGTVSAVTIFGNAGEMYAYGTQYWAMDIGILIGLIIIAKVFIPILYPLKMISIFQYIEDRFKCKWLRQATVVLQLIGGYIFIGLLLYPPSLALKYIIGLSISLNIIIIGITCTAYSAFGGVKAVVYTDVLQSLVMVAGVLAIVIQGSITHGGLDNVIDIAYHKGRIEFFNLSLDPYQRHSFWLCLILGVFFTLGTYGVTQSQTQRCFSTGSVRQAQWVLYYAAIGMLVLRGLIHLSGLVMFAAYQYCDPLTAGKVLQDPAAVVTTYVIQKLTKIPGLAGIFVAAVYAAVLSSVSTQLNSLTALLWEDFLKNLPIFKSWTEVKIGGLQKIIVFATGILGILIGLAVSQLGMSFLQTVFAINGALSGPLIGLFIVALYLPWVNYKGASLGFVVSIILNVILVSGQLSMPDAPYLPLSREGCNITPINTINTTLLPNTTILSNTTHTPSLTTISSTPTNPTLFSSTNIQDSNIMNTQQPPTNTSPTGEWLFGGSYCLNSLWGMMICILVAIIVTMFTGSNTPEDVEEKLIAPRSWQWFQRSLTEQANEFLETKILRRKSRPDKNVDNDPSVTEPLNKSHDNNKENKV